MTIIFYIFFCVLISFSANAATLNVNSSTGNDSNTYAQVAAGTHTWATLGRALWGNANRSTPNASEAATAGDTVLVAAGTYTAPDTGVWNQVAFQPVNEGTSEGARIIIRASGVVNLYSTGTSGGPIIGSLQKDYITWDGFSIDETAYANMNNGEQANVLVNDASYITVQNCILKGRTLSLSGANHAGIFYHTVSNGRIYNNTIYDVYADDSNCAGIYFYGSSNITVENNTIYNSSSGIFVKSYTNSGITIYKNKIYSTTYYGIRMGGSGETNINIVVYQNIVYNAGSYDITSYTNNGSGCKVVNNTVYNSLAGLGHHSESTEILFYNNIVHTTSESAIGTENYTQLPTVHDWQHNVYYGIPAGCQWMRDHATCQNWTYWTETWNLDGVSPAGSNAVDPLLANPAGGDFRLCTAAGVPHASCSGASPFSAQGVDILDLDGDSSTVDNIPAGAYITGNETIGVESASTARTAAGVTFSGASFY